MKNAVMAGLLVASTCLLAQEYKPFVGVELSSSKVEWKTSGRDSGSETGYGLRAGFMADDHRIYLGIGQANTDKDNVRVAAVNLEGLTSPYKLSNWLDTRFFAGAHIGTGEYSDKYDLIYGAQGGVIFGLPVNLGLEIGGRYTFTQADNVDHGEAVYSALNYQF